MTDVFDFRQGNIPLLVSIPHDGRLLAPGMKQRMTVDALDLPDTDWHVRRLYGFVDALGASVLAANYSRYVVDLNRAASGEALYPDQHGTGLCPENTFAGSHIYADGQAPDAAEQQQRIGSYWQPYHLKLDAELQRLRDSFGYALLWDAHSIPGQVPLLFDGALPDLNIGTFDGASCDERLAAAVLGQAQNSTFTSVVNGRFKGGFITRHYGQPQRNIHALQLELAQRCYMNESSREYDEKMAEGLVRTLSEMLTAYVGSGQRHLSQES